MMEILQVDKSRILYPANEEKTAALLCKIVKKNDQLMLESWGLNTPDNLCILIMNSWQEYLDYAPPKNWQLIIKILSPILYQRFERIWPLIGGWEQRFGTRRTVGLKPPELLVKSKNNIGEEIFITINDSYVKFQLNACHELTHAYSAHLNLPSWLKEGIAMVSADRYIKRQTVKQSTLNKLGETASTNNPRTYRKIHVTNPGELIYFYICSYWATRLIEETQPGLIKSLLAKRLSHKEFETQLSAAYNVDLTEFWNRTNQLAIIQFQEV